MKPTTRLSPLEMLLALTHTPVAISFVDAPPPNVPRVSELAPAGCAFWLRAARGEVFYTLPEDHKRCPVGAHTHNVPLTDADKKELEGLVGTMVGLEYLTMDDVAKIPTRRSPLAVAVYAPLAQAPVRPDVVLVRGTVRHLMLLAEAAQAAGFAATAPTMGRPTCAVIPEAINGARPASSFGCIGNRVYTQLTDGEGYAALPGPALAAIEAKLGMIVRANHELEKFHHARVRA
jgi:uncharacterized protein (DUF169 family)